MTLDTSGTVPTTAISTYRPGRMMVGSITDAQQLMYQVMFQSSQVVCAGTTHLKVYDYTGREDESRRTLIYGWYLAAVEAGVDDPMMAFVPDAQYGTEGGMRDVRMMRANVDEIVRMPFACTTLVARATAFTADRGARARKSGRLSAGSWRHRHRVGDGQKVTLPTRLAARSRTFRRPPRSTASPTTAWPYALNTPAAEVRRRNRRPRT